MQPSRLSLMAALFAAAGKSMAPLREFEEFQRPTPSLAGVNKYRPHQGKRECARRRGGQDWMRQRNEERERRGLPTLWAFFDSKWETRLGTVGGGPANTHNIPRFDAGFRDTSNDGGYVQ